SRFGRPLSPRDRSRRSEVRYRRERPTLDERGRAKRGGGRGMTGRMKTTHYLLFLATLGLAGCSSAQRDPPLQVWTDMKHQARFRPQLSTEMYPDLQPLFADGRQTRALPEGVVARGHMVEDNPYNTGMDGKNYVGRIPVPITDDMINEGQARFNVFC